MTPEVKLVNPDMDLISSFIDCAKELIIEGRARSISGFLDYVAELKNRGVNLSNDIEALEQYPEDYLAKLLNMKNGFDLAPSYSIPRTSLWILVNGQVVGDVVINHFLKDEAARRGINIPGYSLGQDHYSSHIGYQIKPAERSKGYATKALSLALNYCRGNLKIEKVAISCNSDNLGSKRIIEKNGGVQTTPFITESGDVKLKFWIDLK
jgi:predicted acetyltransferase